MTKNLNLQIINQYQVNQTTFRDWIRQICHQNYLHLWNFENTQVDLFFELKNNENWARIKICLHI